MSNLSSLHNDSKLSIIIYYIFVFFCLYGTNSVNDNEICRDSLLIKYLNNMIRKQIMKINFLNNQKFNKKYSYTFRLDSNYTFRYSNKNVRLDCLYSYL